MARMDRMVPVPYAVALVFALLGFLGAVGTSVAAGFVRRSYGPLASMRMQLYAAYGWGGCMIVSLLVLVVGAFFLIRPWEGSRR